MKLFRFLGFWGVVLPGFVSTDLSFARQQRLICGTTREKLNEELHLHRQSERKRIHLRALGKIPAGSPSIARDTGNIAILDDSDGVVARRNDFNLDQKTLAFIPSAAAASRYTYQVNENGYDAAAAASGVILAGLQDDDFRQVDLAFSFPFFGATYRRVFVNSDGNISFEFGESGANERTLGKLAGSQARVAALFRDLDPSQSADGVRVLSEAGRLVVSWVSVPELTDSGTGRLQTFQIRIYPTGRIEVAYDGVSTRSAVVGISPGGLKGPTSIVDFRNDPSAEYSATVAERFTNITEIDTITAAQKFYETHEDAYDYLVFFNNLDIPAEENALSFEETVRNHRSGYGDTQIDVGSEFGSAYRLQAIINMGQLSNYPKDPNAHVELRGSSPDTPLSVLAHEAGHLFLAYASVRVPEDPKARPMLGYQLAHWNFFFDSDASFLEGNRIRDDGPATSPRFTTTGAVEHYSFLDQYLMGLRAAEEVAPRFLVTGAGPRFSQLPQVGFKFNGLRRDIVVDEVIQAEGRRTPDYTVAQRRFRLAFVLIVRQGTTPSAALVDQVETYRREFETYYNNATSGRAFSDTALRKSLRLSVFPAAGVLTGHAGSASVSIQKPAAGALTVALRTQTGATSLPQSVIIPAGATAASFTITGVRAGVEDVTAEPADTSFETAYARVQVLPSTFGLRLAVLSGNNQVATPGSTLPMPILIQVSDINRLPYPGLRLQASASSSGTVTPVLAVTDANGQAAFRWTPGAGANRLTIAVEGAAESAVIVTTTGPPLAGASALVNSASFTSAVSPGSLATVYGSGFTGGPPLSSSFPWPDTLASVRLLLNGRPVPLLFVSNTQINFLLPELASPGAADLQIVTAQGVSVNMKISLGAFSPGIFFDAVSGFGAVLSAGSSQTTAELPASRGSFVEIYCTGLGTTFGPDPNGLFPTAVMPQVFIGPNAAQVEFSGLAPGLLGLYQVNARIPENAQPGVQSLSIVVNGVRSNIVKVGVR